MVDLTQTQINALFDKNPNTYVELQPQSYWTLFLKKGFRVKEMGCCLYTGVCPPCNNNQYVNLVYILYTNQVGDQPIIIEGCAIYPDEQLSMIQIFNNTFLPIPISHIQIKLFEDTRNFMQDEQFKIITGLLQDIIDALIIP